jgi:hypothetical protein
MGADAGQGCEPARIRCPQYSHFTVVARQILDQPVDGVVRIRRLVDPFRTPRVDLRPHHHELALGAEAPSDILRDEDVAVLGQLFMCGE